jgi:tRNA A37 N6-isopentenylltransferase MiaA
MNELLRNFIESLREELKQYGELLALLDLEQEQVIHQRSDDMLATVAAINAQGEAIQAARREREQRQRELAQCVGLPGDTAIAMLANFVPEPYRPLVIALMEENNDLLARVQRRARQNHILLSRSLEIMERFVSSLCAIGAPTYNQGGTASAPGAGRALYEEIC